VKKRTSIFTWGATAGLCVGAVLWIGTCVRREWRERHPYKSQWTLSAEEVGKVAEAVRAYEQARGARPERLERLIEGGLLSAGELFDRKRRPIPRMDSSTGRLESDPDVMYMPALRKGDPPDLVLLHTLFTRERGRKLPAVLNDYRVVEYTPRELTMALNRTYAYIARQLPESQPAP
jgi:hypothetical protein